MNIEQLESYNLDDAVKFHDQLNPLLWDKQEHLKPEIQEHLLKIAEDFAEFLGVDSSRLIDITISGSNAAYSYTPSSDIDLHLVVDFSNDNEVYRELFDAKKTIYNTEHNIKVKGIPVELYAQAADQAHHSQGIYSLLHNKWLQIPRRRRADIDDVSVQSKFEEFERRAAEAIKSKSHEEIDRLLQRIRAMRQAGLDQHGEFGPENLAFKLLRNQGIIEKLRDERRQIRDRELSLKERIKKPTTYGFGRDYIEEVGITPDGTNPSTCQFTNETDTEPRPTDEAIIEDFIAFCSDSLNLEREVNLKLRRDPQWPVVNRTFGRYDENRGVLEVAFGQRHIMDVLRTIAHELVHQRQHETTNIPADGGDDGSPYENEANARAGILMRQYGKLHPELFNYSEDSLEEGWGKKAAAAAATVAALSGAPAHSAGLQNYIGAVQNIGTAAHTMKGVNWNAMLQSEGQLALWNYIRANGGDPTAQNLSQLYQWQKRMEQDRGQAQSTANTLPGYTQQPNPVNENDSIDSAGELDPIEKTEQNIDRERLKNALRAGMKSLTSAETAVLNMRFWKDLSLEQIAQALGVTASRVNQIEARALRKLYNVSTRQQLRPFIKEATGYIPTAAEANDPRFKMALTVDVHPGEIGRCANAFLLNTDSQGHPQELRPDGLVKRMMAEYLDFKKKVITEAKSYTGRQVLSYIKKIHPRGEFTIDSTVTNHPVWLLTRVPLSSLHVPDPKSGVDIDDPYNRVQMIDMQHVADITPQEIESKPIVVDTDGYIIDGNHRALAAKLSGMTSIAAYIPDEEAEQDQESYAQHLTRIRQQNKI